MHKRRMIEVCYRVIIIYDGISYTFIERNAYIRYTNTYKSLLRYTYLAVSSIVT